MKQLLLSFTAILIMQVSFAQEWKKTAVLYNILQDDAQTTLLTIAVPENSTINTASNFALYEKGKSSLTINYELDDDANMTVKQTITDKNVDLLKYANGISDKVLAGTTDVTISNKTVVAKIQTINGYQAATITYDYKRVISGANITETGKVVLYIIKTTGTSMINTDEHALIIRLKFDYQQNGGDNLTKTGAEIIGTIKKGEE